MTKVLAMSYDTSDSPSTLIIIQCLNGRNIENNKKDQRGKDIKCWKSTSLHLALRSRVQQQPLNQNNFNLTLMSI